MRTVYAHELLHWHELLLNIVTGGGKTAVIGAVIGEFVGSESGLGYLILVSTSQSRTPLAFGALVLLTIMSIVLYYGIALIERIVVPWAPRN